MNILFLMISFPYESNNANLYTELADECVKQKHNVFVATISEKKLCQSTAVTKEKGLNILRIKTGNVFNVGFIEKGISTLRLPYAFKAAIKDNFADIKFDLVISPTPPITFYEVLRFLKKRDRCKIYLILRDIFPQNAKDLGLIKNFLLFSYFRRKERKLYEISDSIGCMSKGNIDYVKTHNKIENSKLHLLSNWKRVSGLSIQKKDFRTRWRLGEKIIAVFGGVIGISQELEFLVELAERFKEDDRVIFLVIGSGNQKKKIKQLIKDKKLDNFIVKDIIPREDFKSLLLECDIGLINLNRLFTIPNIPSKTLDYFEMSLPILATTDKNTDYKSVLEDAQAGLHSLTGELEAYVKNLDLLLESAELRQTLGQNGHKYLLRHLTVERAYNTIMEQLKRLDDVDK